MPKLAGLLAVGLTVLLSGCNAIVLDPKGLVGLKEKQLIATSTWAMLIVVIPVCFLSLYFAWRYRATNKDAEYKPTWSHSTAIEVVVWTVPTLIIIFLGWLTWVSTHELDPYRPLDSQVKPIEVDVVALDWKWLFIYPDLKIASVNQMAMPVGTPVNFKITSDAVMNSFFIPQLGGQIYAMAGMKTQLHLIADTAGDYEGLSANYSGAGFSDMKFRALALSPADFQAWVEKVRAAPAPLDAPTYKALVTPSEKNPVAYYGQVDSNLFDQIVAKYNVTAGSHMGVQMDMSKHDGKTDGMNGMKQMDGKPMQGMDMPAAASAPRG